MKTKIALTDIKIGNRKRKELGDLTSLARSMETVGLLNPVTLDEENNLIAGYRRLEAARILSWDEIQFRVANGLDDILKQQAEYDENECRKPFTPSEAVEAAKPLEEFAKKQAKQRQGARTDKHSGKFPQCSGGKVRDKVGEAVGMSGRTYSKAKAVVTAAEEDPETFGPIKDEMDNTGKVSPAYDKVRKAKSANGDDGRKRVPSPASTMRGIDSIAYAVGALEKINVDRLTGIDREEAIDGLSKVRTRISRLIKLMRG